MSTLENIDSSNQIMKKSVRSIEKGKREDPLPTLREQERISSTKMSTIVKQGF